MWRVVLPTWVKLVAAYTGAVEWFKPGYAGCLGSALVIYPWHSRNFMALGHDPQYQSMVFVNLVHLRLGVDHADSNDTDITAVY